MINPEFTPEDEALLNAASQPTLSELYGALRRFYALDDSSLEQTSVSTAATENTQKVVEVYVTVAPSSDDIRRDEHGRKIGTRLASVNISNIGDTTKLVSKLDRLVGDYEFYYIDDASAEDGAFFELYEVGKGRQLLCDAETVSLVRQLLPDSEETQLQSDVRSELNLEARLNEGVMSLYRNIHTRQADDKSGESPEAA